MNKYIAEGIGTFILVFMGAGAAIVNNVRPGSITHVGVALTFGLVVLALIYTIGDVSGAHVNPAVTIGFWASGRFPKEEVIPYLTAQFLGAISAALMHRIIFENAVGYGVTTPFLGAGRAFLLELVLTCFLMFVILNVSTGAKEKGITAGIAVGSVIGLEAMFAGPMTGASMNPARSFGPALLTPYFQHLWIYLFAPNLGAVLAVYVFKFVRPECALPQTAPVDKFSSQVKETWNS